MCIFNNFMLNPTPLYNCKRLFGGQGVYEYLHEEISSFTTWNNKTALNI